MVAVPGQFIQDDPTYDMVAVPGMHLAHPFIPARRQFFAQKAVVFNVIHGLQKQEANNAADHQKPSGKAAKHPIKQGQVGGLNHEIPKHIIVD